MKFTEKNQIKFNQILKFLALFCPLPIANQTTTTTTKFNSKFNKQNVKRFQYWSGIIRVWCPSFFCLMSLMSLNVREWIVDHHFILSLFYLDLFGFFFFLAITGHHSPMFFNLERNFFFLLINRFVIITTSLYSIFFCCCCCCP